MAIQKSSKKKAVKIDLIKNTEQIDLVGLETLPHPAKPDRISLKKKGAKVLEDNENEQSSVDNYAAAGVTGGEKYASAAGVSVSSSGTTDVVPVGSSEPGNLDKEDHDDRAGALLSDGSANVESTGIHPAWYAAGIASVGGGAALGLAAGAGGAVAAGGAAALASASGLKHIRQMAQSSLRVPSMQTAPTPLTTVVAIAALLSSRFMT